MAQSKHDIQSALAGIGARPRHRFGQNFMIDQNLVRRVADAGEIQPGELIIEVGPGTGTLTDELLARGGRVVAVEIDRDLANLLRERFAETDAFSLIEGDALAGKHALNPALLSAIRQTLADRPAGVKLVANLPYNIASPLIVELLLEGVELLAFTVQKEVADRLRAGAGGEDYGPLTVIVQMLAAVEVLRTLPPQAFWPAPKIDSALVRLRRQDQLGEQARDFSRFVHQLFAARRKTLRKALSQAGHDPAILSDLPEIDPQWRPEVLPPPLLWALFQRLRP